MYKTYCFGIVRASNHGFYWSFAKVLKCTWDSQCACGPWKEHVASMRQPLSINDKFDGKNDKRGPEEVSKWYFYVPIGLWEKHARAHTYILRHQKTCVFRGVSVRASKRYPFIFLREFNLKRIKIKHDSCLTSACVRGPKLHICIRKWLIMIQNMVLSIIPTLF